MGALEQAIGELDQALRSADRPRTPAEESAFLKLARDRFLQGEEAEDPQRARELEDLRFAAGDQWPAEIRLARQGQTAVTGQLPVPPRPCLVIDKTKEGINNVLGELSQAELTAELVPADDFEGLIGPSSDTEIQLREGLLRRIFRAPDAETTALWAAKRMVIAGRGYCALDTRFVRASVDAAPSPQMMDQEVYVRGFYNQACVMLDPSHEMADGSDAKWGFIGSDLPWEEYEAAYPDAAKHIRQNRRSVSGELSQETFRALGDDYPGWFKHDGRTVRVVDYFYTTTTDRELCLLADGSMAWQDAVPKGAIIKARRTVVQSQIKRAQIDGMQILDETEWAGPDIPIVKFTGDELQPYDNERRTQGLIRSAIDSQRAYNYMVSKWVETIGLAPIPPIMMAAGQDEGFETEWDSMSTRTLGRLHYKQTDSDGRPAPPPTRPPVDTQIGPIASSIQIFDEGIQATIGVHDPTLGYPDHTIRSGKALQQVSGQNRQGTSGYMRNYIRSWRRIGEIANNLLYPIYGIRPGRITQILNLEGKPQTITVGAGTTAAPGSPTFTLTPNAAFNVIVKVGRKYDSRRQQEASELGALIGDKPELLGVFGDVWAKHLDGPGHEEIAERLKVMLVPQVQAFLASKASGQEMPPEALAQLAQGHALVQRLTQEVNALSEQQKTDGIKAQRDVALFEREAALKIKLQEMDDAKAIRVAEINALTKGVTVDATNQANQIALNEQLAHDHATAAASAAHDERMMLREHVHDHGQAAATAGHEELMAQQAHQQALAQGQQQHQQTLEQGQQAAALAPDQAPPGEAPT